MYISSRHKQQTLANYDHDISICDSKIQVSSVEQLLGVTISNTLCWDAHIDHLIKTCNSYLFLLSRIKVFYLEGTEYCFTTLIFYLILISVVLSGVTVARVILDCDFIHHSQNYLKNSIGKHSQKELHIQNAILKYIIINNICPDYLKNYVSYTSDISCRHTRSTNCNQLYTPTPNCELFRKSFMYSGAAIWNSLPYMLKLQLQLTLLNLYI